MIESSLDEEKALWKKGYKYIAGIDEVGRGSWAGPLVVGAVILPTNFIIPTGFADSKHVKPAKRREFAAYIYERIKTYSIAEVPVAIINKLGIGKATHIGFRKAIRLLSTKPDYLLIDAFYIRHVNRKNQKAIVHGDEKSASIAAASIIAKVYRDNLMKNLAKKYPLYLFAKHKGYGTTSHQNAIRKYGFSQVHRRSFNLSFLNHDNAV
ncbi:MAG: ribonuclease HII [uncultured bacterium]|uniref:Ribonuclease HII n=1 Tax=Candidatus Curtissbacteria bacterium RIFOXYA1_FULL_41_14 TaxID=1797737 RepID=A0A1F5HFJ1_9BACT|nr:MAG: ribonuclease HII [uncultured bacterium]KKR60120.1 MAG: Ribonuclease HII [Candidatus Curtissbacteria bacterium GW2011_GWA2_40_31]OGD79478.1 MAG: ribonuclease HII [Candidatus Curtissbacteria bacterium RIFCSPHIGHO2_01_FULL_34_40]OGD92971.1 MAG: ribonuclease HII [Candidatus Curtissbacteria bacterium RIFCSPHIGHO2_12_FULL_41_13]OGD96084.1 MAG: ribonuclease HII [Candidatus Curtissbacteria bacterium RIFCSPLOWO2_01_FULL_41_28]OGE02812.1 MAG: ribonuclease HII [Candidatus Curtissbacteria bacteriu